MDSEFKKPRKKEEMCELQDVVLFYVRVEYRYILNEINSP